MRHRTTGLAAVGGGLLWALVPLLDDVYPPYELVVGVVPALLLVGAYGLHRRYGTGRQEHRLLTVGLGFSTVAAVAYAYAVATEGGLASFVFVGVPAALGLLLVGVGSAFTAYRLRKRAGLPLPVALLFGASLPLDPLFNALLAAVASFGVSLYGVAWTALGGWVLFDAAASDPASARDDLS